MEVLLRDAKLWRNGRRLLHMKKTKDYLWILLPEEYAPVTSSYLFSNCKYSTFSNRDSQSPFLRYDTVHKFRPYQDAQRRGFGMFVVKVLRGVLKVRYLVLGGAIGGGLSLQNTYREWKSALPDLSWMDKYMPQNEDWETMRVSFLSIRDKIKELELDPQLRDTAESKFLSVKNWLDMKLEEAYMAAEQADDANDDKPDNQASQMVNNAVTVNALSFRKEEKEQQDEYKSQITEKDIWDLEMKYQKELERLERENQELRKQILIRNSSSQPVKRVQTSLIDMYSDVLDELNDYDMTYKAQDHLPRVVVIGDQSSGKTSVLEMIAQARIFPRGAGEMMTRAPVKVTLSEGPYHIAQFKDSTREFDLTKESDLADLRKEVEFRMCNLTKGNQTVSNDVISMTVKGPGLQRMVLVDLPGIISTNTLGMASETKENIYQIARHYMSNPNAIILCIQDGSVDAERSNVTDLVSQMDPVGKRTIFVLTKVDLAEENFANPDRIRKILAGELFPMKALGYFAVVTGRGSQNESIKKIKEYEERFFRNSKIFSGKNIKMTQITTRNLGLAVSECFWKMVRETVEQQADAFKAQRFNLETEWKNNYRRQRILDRSELFDKGRSEILDQVVNLCEINVKHWEDMLAANLWNKVKDIVFENIYLSAAHAPENGKYTKKNEIFHIMQGLIMNFTGEFNTQIDIHLSQWAEQELPQLSVEAGWETLQEEFKKLIYYKSENHDEMFDNLKTAVAEEVLAKHQWESKATDVLRVLQINALADRIITDKGQWDTAVKFLESSFRKKLEETERAMKDMFGPSTLEKWYKWKYSNEDQNKRNAVKSELEKILFNYPEHLASLSEEEYTTIRNTLKRSNIICDNDYISSTWFLIYRKFFLNNVLQKVPYYMKGFYLYKQGIDVQEYNEVVLYWRIQQTCKVTVNSLRQQIINREALRMDEEIQEVLEGFSRDREKMEKLITGRRVEIAEELKKVKQIQEKLEGFIKALNKEKTETRRLH
ncbi:dynamin-like 120 kDa protein, mitochondrial isoform X2 [Planococcus citri]|uniref:dynamin-like 120 kDa protein, mitochondrial isoform X2 n=1 Tax=Planococcus citri TaxID=170843 RepID=UPI0031F917D4